MAVSQVRNSLWTPNGPVDLQKDVIVINRRELQLLAALHEFTQAHGLSLVCQKCDSAVTGQNNDTTTVPAVACRCREFKYTAG